MADLWLLVDRQIVERDDITAPERRYEHLLHVGRESWRCWCPSNTAGAVSPYGRSAVKSCASPITAGCVIAQAHAVGLRP